MHLPFFFISIGFSVAQASGLLSTDGGVLPRNRVGLPTARASLEQTAALQRRTTRRGDREAGRGAGRGATRGRGLGVGLGADRGAGRGEGPSTQRGAGQGPSRPQQRASQRRSQSPVSGPEFSSDSWTTTSSSDSNFSAASADSPSRPRAAVRSRFSVRGPASYDALVNGQPAFSGEKPMQIPRGSTLKTKPSGDNVDAIFNLDRGGSVHAKMKANKTSWSSVTGGGSGKIHMIGGGQQSRLRLNDNDIQRGDTEGGPSGRKVVKMHLKGPGGAALESD